MKSFHFRSAVILIMSLGIIAGFVYYLYANADTYLELLRISTSGVAALFVLSASFPLFNGFANTYLFRGLGVNLSHREGFLLAASTSLANQLPLPGGIVTKAIYLKYKHDLSYTDYFSATLALFFCSVAVNGFIGLGVLLYWFLFKRVAVSAPLLIGFTAMAACIFVFWLPLPQVGVPHRVRKWLDQAMKGWALIGSNPALLVKLLGLQTSLMMLFAIRYWLAFRMLSQNITVSQVILLSCASILTQLVSIAPGGLGVQEAIVGGMVSVFGFELPASVAAVELDRLVATFAIVLIGWISTVLLGKKITEASVKPKGSDI